MWGKAIYSFAALSCAAIGGAAAQSDAQEDLTATRSPPPIELYGRLPNVRGMAMSPSGERFAFFQNNADDDDEEAGEFFVVTSLKEGVVGGARTDRVKARGLEFAGENDVVLNASRTTRFRAREKYEHTGSVVFDIERKKLRLMLNRAEGLYPAQSGLGRIVAYSADFADAFMPAFMGDGYPPRYSLLRVNVKSGRARQFVKGRSTTVDWIVSPDGVVLAREDHDEKSNVFTIKTRKSGKWETVVSMEAEAPPYTLFGVTPNADALVVVARGGSDYSSVRRLSFDGALSDPIFAQAGRDVDGVLIDQNRVVLGAQFSGTTPSYAFLDPTLDADVAAFIDDYQGLAIDIRGWTADRDSLLVHIAGGESAPGFYRYDRGAKTLWRAASTYDGLDSADVGLVEAIEYKARDGMTIPALTTFPPGLSAADIAGREPLPLIVMPHGGPAAYDAIGFDFMAQFFASRGYLVLQPNFRGSAGYGDAFRRAGDGEWGGKMQDDVTDGVKVLIRNKWADPSRICIVGASYGGYAALAGGAFTPDIYACVAAIAPVADLRAFQAYVADYRNSEWSDAYWAASIGDRKKDKDKLDAVSPVNHADAYKAPVLLIHGVDDTVVPFDQSRKMHRVLKKAGKSVRLVRLKGEDHWLSVSETRLETLRALDAFVRETIGG